MYLFGVEVFKGLGKRFIRCRVLDTEAPVPGGFAAWASCATFYVLSVSLLPQFECLTAQFHFVEMRNVNIYLALADLQSLLAPVLFLHPF